MEKKKKPVNSEFYGPLGLLVTLICRDDKIRTCDPLHPMQVRYRAALRPETPFRRAAKIRQILQLPKQNAFNFFLRPNK